MSAILSEREKKQWEEIKALAQDDDCLCLDDADAIRMKRVLDLLQEQGYIKNLDVDGTNMFLVLGNLHDFDDWLTDEEQKAKKLSRREWAIALGGAIVGAIISGFFQMLQ